MSSEIPALSIDTTPATVSPDCAPPPVAGGAAAPPEGVRLIGLERVLGVGDQMSVGTGIGDDICAGDYQYDLGAHRYLGRLSTIQDNGELLAVVDVGRF